MDELLRVEDLTIEYRTDEGTVHALGGITLSLKRGETLGLVGETGAGKTTLARGIMGLIPNPPGKILNGSVYYEERDLLRLPEKDMRGVRGEEISMIFQDPMTSLNPVMTVAEQIAEAVREHNGVNAAQAYARACEMLEMVGISAERADEYPHQFSGGMKQRVMIGIALACNPKLLIADEPTTALDVTIQAQILEMIASLKQKLHTSVLLITHDLGIVAQNCDRVCIMYAGEIVESGGLSDIFQHTAHPYTQGLLESIPVLTSDVERLQPIPGSAPDPTDLPAGCRFHPRCRMADARCAGEAPPVRNIGETHSVRCWHGQQKGGTKE